MDFLELARLRHSTRQFTSQPVEKEKLDYIIECARLAPSAVNRQPYTLYIADSNETKHRLAACNRNAWVDTAPVIIAVCAHTGEAWVRQLDGKNHADIDAAIITEHICLAAAQQGLATCWICSFDTAQCSRILSLPEGDVPVALIPLGYEAEEYSHTTTRKPAEELVRHV